MEDKNNFISPICKKRLYIQGYQDYSDKELNDYKYGIRFAYLLCTILVGLGLAFSNKTLLIIAAVIAFAGIFPPYHPFDFVYNYAVRRLVKKPKVPPRTNQGRFACGIGSVWLTFTIYLLYNNHTIAGNILGGILFLVAILVSTMDICIPSMIYNSLFRK